MRPYDRIDHLTAALCEIPSVTGNEQACARRIEALLGATPFTVDRIGETILARGPARGRPLVLLVGHTDTVPGHGPAPVRIENGRVHGLGASDMKGGLAVMITLAERLDPARVPYDIGFVFYDREEGPWAESGLGPALERAPWLTTAALAFCLEPSDNDVQVGCLGTMHASIVFHGRAAHSARPWQGRNAIEAAGPLLSALGAGQPVEHDCGGFQYREVMCATLAQGGRTRNVIPDRFELNVNYRFAPGKTLSRAEEDLSRFVREHAPDATITVQERAPSGRVVTANALLNRFLALNGNKVTAKQAWTDVARFSEAGVDAVNLGPGLASQAHQAGEYAETALLHASYEQFLQFLTQP